MIFTTPLLSERNKTPQSTHVAKGKGRWAQRGPIRVTEPNYKASQTNLQQRSRGFA